MFGYVRLTLLALAMILMQPANSFAVGGGTCMGPDCQSGGEEGWMVREDSSFLGGLNWCIPYEDWVRMSPEDQARHCHSVCFGISPGGV